MKIFLPILGVLVAASLLCTAEEAGPNALRINLVSPLDYQVVQRATRTEGKLIITGSVMPTPKEGPLPDALEARLTGKSSADNLPGKWQKLPFDARVAGFRGELIAPAGGWYRLEVRALRGEMELVIVAVEHVGVGEVFVIAGQSNSANYGEEKQNTRSGLVAAFDGTTWQLANDPQPGAGGTRGSFLPSFGDTMAGRLHVPIGVVPTGIGSTSAREWLPAGTRLPRLPTITRNVVTVGPGEWEAAGKIFSNFTGRMKLLGLHGFRAVLWHQGESDAHQAPDRTLPGDLYRQELEQLIRDSRKEIGWEAPWFVAQVSYHGTNDTASPDIRAAQKALWDAGVALEGPDTDTLTGEMRDKNGTGVHLSGKGLREHGRLWAAKVGPWVEKQTNEAKR
jgi:hypothetical protein